MAKIYRLLPGQGCDGDFSINALVTTTSSGQEGQAVATRTTDCPGGYTGESWTISVDGEVLVNAGVDPLPASVIPATGTYAGIQIFITQDPDFRTLNFEVQTGFEGNLDIDVSYTTTNACAGIATSVGQVRLNWVGPVSIPEVDLQTDNIILMTGLNSLDNMCPSGITSYQWNVLGLTEGVDYNYTGGTSSSSPQPEFTFEVLGSYTMELTVETACGTDTAAIVVVIGSTNTTDAIDDDFSGMGMVGDETVYNIAPLANDTDPEGDNQTITHINGIPISVGNPVVVGPVTYDLQADGTINVSSTSGITQTVTYSIVDNNQFPATDTASIDLVFAAVMAPLIATPPDPQTVCDGAGVATFTGLATPQSFGTISYQWEVSINGGASYAPIADDAIYADTNTASMTATNPPASYNGYLYRFTATESTSGLSTSSPGALLHVASAPVITGPVNSVVNAGNAATFIVTHTLVTGTASYQWEESQDGGGTWNDVTNGGDYSGADQIGLTIQNPDASKDGYLYRVEVCDDITDAGGTVSCCATSNSAQLTVTANTTDAIDDSYTTAEGVMMYPGGTYAFPLTANDNDPEGDNQTIVEFNGQALTVGTTYNLSDGRGTFELLANGQIQITWAAGSAIASVTYQYEITDDNTAPATDTANATFEIIAVNAIVAENPIDDPVGAVRGDFSGDANTFVCFTVDVNGDGTPEYTSPDPLPAGPVGDLPGDAHLSGQTTIGGTVYGVQVWSDANRTGFLIDQDLKQFPTPNLACDDTTLAALAVTAANDTPDSFANTVSPGNYTGAANDLYSIQIFFDELTGNGYSLTNVGFTYNAAPGDTVPIVAANFSAIGVTDATEAAAMAAAFAGTMASHTINGTVFQGFGTGNLNLQLSIQHSYNDGFSMISSNGSVSPAARFSIVNCPIAAATPPTVNIIWDGDNSYPDDTSMTINGLLADGVTAHNGTINYDVTIATHLGTYTVNGVTRGTPIPALEVANIAAATGVNILSGNVENFSYQHPPLDIPAPTLGTNSELVMGSAAAATPQFGVDISVVANEGGLQSTSAIDRSYFFNYIWENGESVGTSGVSPWTPNNEDGLPSTIAGYWYFDGSTGPGTANPVGPDAAYITQLDPPNNVGGPGGPFSHNLYHFFVHGVEDLEMEIDGVFTDIQAAAGLGALVTFDNEWEQAINYAEGQAVDSNGALMLVGSVNGRFVESGDPESILFGQALPGTVGGVNFGTTAAGMWGGWYELQNTQAVLGRLRMTDPSTGNTVIWVNSLYVR